jgi:hypothetical protein
MLKRILLLASLLLASSLPAQSTTVTLGFWDQSSNVNAVNQFGVFGSGTNTISHFYLGNNWGGVVSVVNDPVTNFYELAVNNVFNTLPDTARFYATFQGVTTPVPQLNIPSIFQASSIQPGEVFVDQVFICGAGSALFCDNYPGLGNQGTGLAAQTWTGTGNAFPTLSAIAPGSPYDLTLVVHIASSLCTSTVLGCTDFVDMASAVAVTPSAVPPAPVPGPIVGGGIPGLLALGAFLLYRKRAGGRELA